MRNDRPADIRPRSPFGRGPATLKLGLTAAVIVAGASLPPRLWPAHGALAVLVFVGQTLAGVPVRYLLRRLALFLPAVGVLAISLPLANGGAEAWELAGGILLRSTLAFLAMLWLVNVSPLDELLVALRRMRVPAVLVAMLAFMHRYTVVLAEELNRMRTARRARGFGDGGRLAGWRTSAQMVAMLVIRSFDRAERVHGAMRARGWDGRVRSLDEARPAGGGA